MDQFGLFLFCGKQYSGILLFLCVLKRYVMNRIYVLLFSCSFLLFACEESTEVLEESISVSSEAINFASFGDSITADSAISAEEMYQKYLSLENGDTIEVKFASMIENVCQKKGCWMTVELTDEESAYIRFKDYGFFMPFNASESEVIISGLAFVTKRTVAELRHDAEDANKSQEEIDAITEPEIAFGFEANGVLIKED